MPRPVVAVWTFLRAHPYAVAAVVLFLALIRPLCSRGQSDWELVYLPAAERLTRGEELLQASFVYPPVNAYFGLPFLGLSSNAARVAWLAVNVAALAVLVAVAWRVAGGGRLQGPVPASRTEHAIFGLGLACGIYFALDAITNQQSDLVVAALVVVGCWALVGGRAVRAAVLFGVAAGVKCTPLLFAPYLAWRGRWLAAAVVPLVAVGINLLPDWTHPPALPTEVPRLVHWAKTYLVPMADKNHDAGTWASSIAFNHSLAGLSNRLLVHERPEPGQVRIDVRPDRVDPATLKRIVLGTGLALLGVALLASWRGARAASANPALTSLALECSLVLLLMLFLSPQSSKPHFCTLLLPGFCLARAAVVGRRRDLAAFLAAAIACGLASNKDLVGRSAYDFVMWFGSVTATAGFLFVGCCWALAFPTKPAVEKAVEPEPLAQAA